MPTHPDSLNRHPGERLGSINNENGYSTMNRFCRHLCEGMIAVSIALPVPTLAQQARSVPVAVEARNDLPGVEVRATLNVLGPDDTPINRALGTSRQSFGASAPESLAIRIGEHMDVCVTASQSGYFTVWSLDLAEAHPKLVYPNAFAQEAASERGDTIEPGEEKCIGRMQGFMLTAIGPAGESSIQVFWTAELEDQLAQDDFPVIGSKSAMSTVRSLPTDSYASTTLYFDVTE